MQNTKTQSNNINLYKDLFNKANSIINTVPSTTNLEYKKTVCSEHPEVINSINDKLTFGLNDKGFLESLLKDINKNDCEEYANFIESIKKNNICFAKIIYLISFIQSTVKKCNNCNLELPKTSFSGLRKTCKDCIKNKSEVNNDEEEIAPKKTTNKKATTVRKSQPKNKVKGVNDEEEDTGPITNYKNSLPINMKNPKPKNKVFSSINVNDDENESTDSENQNPVYPNPIRPSRQITSSELFKD
jgi:hypothetical protein